MSTQPITPQKVGPFIPMFRKQGPSGPFGKFSSGACRRLTRHRKKIMYLKVYGKQNHQDTSVEEVQASLPSDMKGLTVDMDLGYPCVEFPQGAKYNPEYLKVQHALQDAGFETE